MPLIVHSHEHIDARYYISRVLIPPLERIFNLLGADVRGWYDEMAKPLRMEESDVTVPSPQKEGEQADTTPDRLRIQEHFLGSECIVCNAPAYEGEEHLIIRRAELTYHSIDLCDTCYSRPQETICHIFRRIQVVDTSIREAHLVCVSCSDTPYGEPIKCESLDCPWLYERKKLENRKIAFAESMGFAEEMMEQNESLGERTD